MTANSVVVKGVEDWYDALVTGSRPPVYADGIPPEAASSAVEVRGEAGAVQQRADRPPLETVRVTLTGFFPSRSAADTWADLVATGGRPWNDWAGLAMARTLPLPAGWAVDELRAAGPPDIGREPQRGAGAAGVYRCRLAYAVRVTRA